MPSAPDNLATGGESRVVRVGRWVTVIRIVVIGDGGKPLAGVSTTHAPG